VASCQSGGKWREGGVRPVRALKEEGGLDGTRHDGKAVEVQRQQDARAGELCGRRCGAAAEPEIGEVSQ
jgi:hypothetical protein